MLDVLTSWTPNKSISVRTLTFKVTMLLMLLSARRGQTIIDIDINNIRFEDSRVIIINLGKLFKTSTKHFHEPPIQLCAFEDKDICIVTSLKIYLQKTSILRGQESQLLISYAPPHQKICRDTLSK